MDERDADILDRPLRALQGWSEGWPDWAGGAAERVQAFDPDELSSGQVVGIAVGVAAALGGLLVALGPGEDPAPRAALARGVNTRVAARRAGGKRRRSRRGATEIDGITLGERAALTLAPLAEGFSESAGLAATQLEQGRQAVTAQASELAARGEKMTRGTRKELRKQADELQGQIRRLQKELAKQSKRAGRNVPSAKDVRGAASDAGSNVGKRAAAVGATAAAAAAALGERARSVEVPGQVRQFAGSTRDRAAAAGASAAAAAAPLLERARNVELPEQVRGLADTTRGRAADLSERVREEFAPLVMERAGRVREDVLPQVAEAATRIGRRFKEAGEESLSDLAGVRNATVTALTAPPPKQERGWVGGSIFGLIIAALIGLVVYYLQDDERRRQFLATAQSVAEQGREIIRDFQGYDEEF